MKNLCLPHKAQRTAAYSVAAFVVAASAAVFPSQLFAYTVPDSCLCWVSGSLAASHVAAVARMVVGIEENCCCVGKGAVDVVGDWLGLEHTGFAQEENHYNLWEENKNKNKQLINSIHLSWIT